MLNDYCEMSQVPEDGNIDESDIDWADLRAFMVNVSKTSTRQQLQKSVIDDSAEQDLLTFAKNTQNLV